VMMWESSKFAKSAAIEMSSVRQGHFAGQLVRVISVTLLYRSVATTDGRLSWGATVAESAVSKAADAADQLSW